MSEYTPTTVDVRDAWGYWRRDPGVLLDDVAFAEFDRWLAAEKAEAVREVIDFLYAQEGDGGHARFAARLVQWWQDSRTDYLAWKGSDDDR